MDRTAVFYSRPTYSQPTYSQQFMYLHTRRQRGGSVNPATITMAPMRATIALIKTIGKVSNFIAKQNQG